MHVEKASNKTNDVHLATGQSILLLIIMNDITPIARLSKTSNSCVQLGNPIAAKPIVG